MATLNQSNQPNLTTMTEFACALADAASEITLKYFRAPLDIVVKTGLVSNMATVADSECEDAMVAIIRKRLPNFGIIREEGQNIQSQNGFNWVLDPIDGTSSFVAGRPIWGTLIGLVDPENKPIIGIIDQPFLRERYVGVVGSETRLNGVKIITNSGSELDQTIILRTTPAMFISERQQHIADAVRKACGSKSIWGGDCYNYACLAAGFGPPTVVIESDMKYFDYAALIPVIQGAGGVITNWQGLPLGPYDTEVIAASNASLHKRIMDVIAAG